MGIADPLPRSKEAPAEAVVEREELVSRVASSSTFERSPRLKAFFLHVCRCALDNKPEGATEHQVGICVYDRPPGYNPNEDNIVRSQARLLRMKLEHHFANEGKDEAIVITIPKGRYLPVFETRSEEPVASPAPVPRRLRQVLIGLVVLFGLVITWLGYLLFQSKSHTAEASIAPARSVSRPEQREASAPPVASAPVGGEVRITAGHTGAPYVDACGRRWEADHYWEGGVPQPGPRHFFPPVANEGLFRTMREAISADMTVSQSQRQFRYDIPVRSGVYELRLYFADSLRQPDVDQREVAQNPRHFQVNLNGHPLLLDFDPIADAGSAAVDVRAFRDVYRRQASPGVSFELGEAGIRECAGTEPGYAGKAEADPAFRSSIGFHRSRRHALERGELLHRGADRPYWKYRARIQGPRSLHRRAIRQFQLRHPCYTGELHC